MDPVANPYTPNAGSRPQELAGRDRELEQFDILLARLLAGSTEQSMIVKGLRGVGKTVLLNTFEDKAEAAGFLTYYHELTPDSSLVHNLARDAESALGQLKLSECAGQKVRDALSHMKSIKLVAPADFGLQVDLRDKSEGTISADLTDLFMQLGLAAKQKKRGVAFFLDEIQFIDEVEYRAMISALHRTTQKGLPITVSAAGLPQVPQLSGEARSYAERLFDFPTIESLSEADAVAALVGPARALGVDYEDDAVRAALAWTAGYPFYIQQLGKHAWNTAEGPSSITLADVEAAIPRAESALDRSIYEVRIQRATSTEKRYMRAMAEVGDGPIRSAAVAGKLGKPASSLTVVQKQLVDKGLIYRTEEWGKINFTVPRFAEYMRRHMPFRQSPGKTGTGRKRTK